MESFICWILFTLCLVACFKQDSSLVLTSSKEVVLENSSVALTCSGETEIQVGTSWKTSLYSGYRAECGLVNTVCIRTGFLLKNNLDCICNDNGSYTVRVTSVDRYQHDSTWNCSVLQEVSNQVIIKVLVPVAHVNLTMSLYAPVYENTNVTFTCTSSYSLPSASIKWYCSYDLSTMEITEVDIKRENQTREDNVISVTEILTYKVNRSVNGWYVFCTGTNMENNETASNKIKLSVIYPPDSPPVMIGFTNGSVYKVIENTEANLACSVQGGNPLAEPVWHCEGISITLKKPIIDNETVFSNISWIAKGKDRTSCRCLTGHVLSNASIYVNVDILYPPGIPHIQLGHVQNITEGATLIEHKSYHLLCTAYGNPAPSEYIWDGPQAVGISFNASLVLNDVKREESGKYICHAQNTMNPTYGGNCTKENNKSVNVDILFKPMLAAINKQDIAEGSTLNVTCQAVSANPNVYSFTWTRDANHFYKNTSVLLLPNVSRDDAMNYTCTVKNRMISTVGEVEDGSASETFNLNVWYRASVTKFVVNGHDEKMPIVTESTNITFTCKIDSNPTSTANITTPNGLKVMSTSTNFLEYNTSLSSCVDSGTYTCSGSNDYNYGQPGQAKLPVRVRCTPMANSDIETDIRSKLYLPVTLQFTAVAFPDPTFTWEKWTNVSWQNLTTDNMFSISSHNLQSNLTVNNFTETTANEYRLIVNNGIGKFIQNYTLIPFDRPGTPTEFRHILELLTDTSITLIWKPGFNGGSPQTFIIMYRAEIEKDWNTTSVEETDRTVMNFTIHGLSSYTRYSFQLFAVNSEGSSGIVTLQIKTKETAAEKDIKPENQVGVIVGSICGVAFIALGAVIGIFVYRKRFSSSAKETESSKLVYQNVPFPGKRQKKSLNAKVPSKKETSFQALQELDDAPPLYNEPTEYYNSPDKIEQFQRIKVSELLPFVLSSSEESFGTEYQNLPTGLQKPCVFARRPENLALNRYNGIYPYDHSRVKIPGMPDFFINACYIDGYAKQNEYIASLGPIRKATYDFKTFWIMVWNGRSDIIVMLTNLREPSGMKCEQYWPEFGTTETYGGIQVTCDKEDAFAEYTTRSFIVSNTEEERRVTHLHYTAWPDKKVPEDVTTLIEFRQRLQITPSTKKGPIIVHCSAGIGRTGTLIALDRLIKEGQCESSVDVFKCVNSMREQRVKMVQTLEQYIYVYKALVNSLYFDSEVIPIQSFQEYVDQTNNNIYSRQFQQLKDSVEKCCKEEHDARAKNKRLVDKNQVDADIPGNQYRVYLYQNRSMDMSDYINAVYVSSFKRKDHFILAQSPLPDTVSDFVCMMYQENCCCVVTMEDLHKPGMSVGQYLPTDWQSQRFGDIKMSCRTLEMKPQYTVREIKMQNSGKIESQEKVAYHFQYNKWMPGNDTPADTKGFVQFIKNVEEYADQLGGENSHVLVHCLKANERSALYSIVTILTEKIHYERQVSVLNTVRHLRTRRRTAITSMEQLKFCYNAVKAYIDMFES